MGGKETGFTDDRGRPILYGDHASFFCDGCADFGISVSGTIGMDPEYQRPALIEDDGTCHWLPLGELRIDLGPMSWAESFAWDERGERPCDDMEVINE